MSGRRVNELMWCRRDATRPGRVYTSSVRHVKRTIAVSLGCAMSVQNEERRRRRLVRRQQIESLRSMDATSSHLALLETGVTHTRPAARGAARMCPPGHRNNIRSLYKISIGGDREGRDARHDRPIRRRGLEITQTIVSASETEERVPRTDEGWSELRYAALPPRGIGATC